MGAKESTKASQSVTNPDSAHGANMVIVPTNSVILFKSDLPRIDLDFPERGIHRPSDYPETVAVS